MQRNPTVDRATFNYGAALGVPKPAPVNLHNPLKAPWERRDAATHYRYADRFTRDLGAVAMVFSKHQWRMEMALRDVRHATTSQEQALAMETMLTIWRDVDTELNRVRCGSLQWFRYGRIGDVIAKVFNR